MKIAHIGIAARPDLFNLFAPNRAVEKKAWIWCMCKLLLSMMIWLQCRDWQIDFDKFKPKSCCSYQLLLLLRVFVRMHSFLREQAQKIPFKDENNCSVVVARPSHPFVYTKASMTAADCCGCYMCIINAPILNFPSSHAASSSGRQQAMEI